MSTSNIVTESSPQLKNNALQMLEPMFASYKWSLVKNEETHIMYTKPVRETDFFEIKIDQTTIHVSTPVRNTNYQYKTSFKNYFDATEYIENKLFDYDR